MKKILFVCLIMLVAMSLFVACGNNEQKHTHEFGEWDVTKNPTCTEEGTKVRYCSCGEKQSEVVVALGHTPAEATIENKIDATYEADGSYDEVVRCSTCNEKLSETSHVIPMLKHTPADAVEENRVEATCYSEGSYDTVVYCFDCGAELERTTHTIDKIAHTPASAVEENIVDSTCYSVGSKDMVVYCSVAECHKELERSTESIGKKSHTPATAVEENRIAPTFEKDGSYQMVIYCSVAECHEELERTTHTLDMLVHHPGSVVIENEVAATCTKEGSYDEVVYCLDDNCGHKELSRKTIVVPIVAHTNGAAVEENRTNATCYSEGNYDSVVYCSVCNTELSRNKVTLQKIAHTPADAVVENLVNATCTTNGSYDEVVYCDVENCKVQISRTTKVIAALTHTMNTSTGKCECGIKLSEASVKIDEITTYYMTLSEAVTAASKGTKKSPALLTIQKDIKLVETYQTISSGVLTIDLNGYEISSEKPRDYGTLYINGGNTNVTITDSGTGGKIVNSGFAGSVIYISGGTLNISGGSISSSSTGYGVNAWHSTIIITNGIIKGGMQAVDVYNCTLNISGGELIGSRYSGGVYADQSTVDISGGKVSYNVSVRDSSLTISGGEFTSGDDCYRCMSISNSTVVISGGSIWGKSVDISSHNSSIMLTLTNGKTEGATFPGGIKVEDTTLNDILDEGVAYWQGDIMLKVGDDATEITGNNVIIKAEN